MPSHRLRDQFLMFAIENERIVDLLKSRLLVSTGNDISQAFSDYKMELFPWERLEHQKLVQQYMQHREANATRKHE